jgi:hypothetical protein
MPTAQEKLQGKVQFWREKAESVQVFLCSPSKKQEGEVYIKVWTPRERRWRALRAFFAFLSLTIFSAFIPIAHFFLVPIFFFSMLLVPFFKYKKQSIVLGGKGICPHCEKPFEIAEGNDEWPMQDVCTECRNFVKIEKAR